MDYIPLDGISYPLLFTVLNPPYDELKINISLEKLTVVDNI